MQTQCMQLGEFLKPGCASTNLSVEVMNEPPNNETHTHILDAALRLRDIASALREGRCGDGPGQKVTFITIQMIQNMIILYHD